jgi:hypothetical protein
MQSNACMEAMQCVNMQDMKRSGPTNVKISMEGKTIEVSGLSLSEIKELIGMNGHAPVSTRAPRVSTNKNAAPRVINGEPDYVNFRNALSEKGKQFLDILKQHPHGLDADDMAEKLGFKTSNQIGGTAGGGMSRIAPRFNVEMDNLYTRETTFKNGDRHTLYKPGKDINQV